MLRDAKPEEPLQTPEIHVPHVVDYISDNQKRKRTETPNNEAQVLLDKE